MTEATRFRYQLFTGLAVALLLLTSGVEGALSVVLAATLLVIGLILFPELRRLGIDLRAYERKSLRFVRLEAGLIRMRRAARAG